MLVQQSILAHHESLTSSKFAVVSVLLITHAVLSSKVAYSPASDRHFSRHGSRHAVYAITAHAVLHAEMGITKITVSLEVLIG